MFSPLYRDHVIWECKTFINCIHNKVLLNSLANLTGFELACEDQIYVRPDAKIINDQVMVWSDVISDPKNARYC